MTLASQFRSLNCRTKVMLPTAEPALGAAWAGTAARGAQLRMNRLPWKTVWTRHRGEQTRGAVDAECEVL